MSTKTYHDNLCKGNKKMWVWKHIGKISKTISPLSAPLNGLSIIQYF